MGLAVKAIDGRTGSVVRVAAQRLEEAVRCFGPGGKRNGFRRGGELER
jgi:hypothetical protein